MNTYYSATRDISLLQLEDRFAILSNENGIRGIRQQLQNIRENEQFITTFKHINTRNIIANIQIEKQAYNRLLQNQLNKRAPAKCDKQKKKKIERYSSIISQQAETNKYKPVFNEEFPSSNEKRFIENECQFSLNNKTSPQLLPSSKFITQLNQNNLAYSRELINEHDYSKTLDKNIKQNAQNQQAYFRQAETIKRSYIDQLKTTNKEQIINVIQCKKAKIIKADEGKLSSRFKPDNNQKIKNIENRKIYMSKDKIYNNSQDMSKSNKLIKQPLRKCVTTIKSNTILCSALKKINNRVKVSQVVCKDSKMRNIKHEIDHLQNTYYVQQKGRKQIKDKINNSSQTLKKYRSVVSYKNNGFQLS